MDTKKGKNIEDQVQTTGLPYRIRLRDESVPLYTGAGTEIMGKVEIRCGMDPSGACGEDYYIKVLNVLDEYFSGRSWKRLFLEGGCYWLASFLHRGIRDSAIIINRLHSFRFVKDSFRND